jgi:DNA topoisomerase-1
MDKKYRKDPAYADDESDIDDDWIAQFEDESREKEIEKAKKKFEKDNEKRKADEETPYDEDVLRGRVEKINDEYDRLKTERGTKKAEIKGKKTEEALAAAIEKIDQKIKTEKFKMEDREKGKEVSLGTRYAMLMKDVLDSTFK